MENQLPSQPPQNTPPPQSPAPPPAPKAAEPDEPGGINLLPQITENEIKTGVYKRKINVVAIAVIGLIGVIILLILLVRGYLYVQSNLLENRRKEAVSSIQKNASVEVKAIATKEKLDKIYTLLTTTIPSSTLVDQIDKAALTSPTIAVTEVDISANGETFVGGSAKTSDVFKQWVGNLTNKAANDYFDKVNLVSFSGNPTDGYKFSIKLSFLKKGVYQQTP
ncbi:MAG TPA: hypothetical protein VLE47_00145 [Candidatus Saccharimonadales bacterium]|nr:hypothetical protein [Candidatus Saccharimonadales bacterium]